MKISNILILKKWKRSTKSKLLRTVTLTLNYKITTKNSYLYCSKVSLQMRLDLITLCFDLIKRTSSGKST